MRSTRGLHELQSNKKWCDANSNIPDIDPRQSTDDQARGIARGGWHGWYHQDAVANFERHPDTAGLMCAI